MTYTDPEELDGRPYAHNDPIDDVHLLVDLLEIIDGDIERLWDATSNERLDDITDIVDRVYRTVHIERQRIARQP